MRQMNWVKALCSIGFLLLLVSNIWTISRWTESRGVYDDLCYLRQAHLFQKFGLRGLDTNIAFDDDDYMKDRLKQIGFPEWNDVKRIPCHTFMPAADKVVLQYPPGTGFALAAFPSGFQVKPLYVLANVAIAAFALLGLWRAGRPRAVALAAGFGLVAIYLMINPAKASYSVPPTMMVCALAGLLTAMLFDSAPRHRWWLAAAIGLLIGISVNFRLPNLLLATGYGLYLLAAFAGTRNTENFLQGLAFGIACLVGMAPTLVANAINAGSPFATTYGGVDAVPPGLDTHVLGQYVSDAQFPLLLIAIAWTALLWRFGGGGGRVQAARLVAVNLAVNLIFFITHPIFTPYYTIPIAALSLWTLLFATLQRGGARIAL